MNTSLENLTHKMQRAALGKIVDVALSRAEQDREKTMCQLVDAAKQFYGSGFSDETYENAKKVLTGKNGALYNAKGKLLATMETYQAQVNVTNTKFQPLGDPQEHEIFTSYGQTLTCTEIVVEDGEFITDLLAGMKSGEMPSWNFQGVIKGRNGSEERLVYNDCVPSGNIDLQNVTVGDLIKRQWSLFVNGAVNQQGKLRA
mgnify:CR=1 FL=1